MHHISKKQGFIYSAEYSLQQIERMMQQMASFKAISGELNQMFDRATSSTSKWANFFSQYAMTTWYKNNGANTTPADWESSIFIELIKESVQLLCDKHEKVVDLMHWAKQACLIKLQRGDEQQ